MEYTPGSGSIPLFPGLHLETCEETVWNIQATVELQTGHIGKGCDRDSYSDRSVRRLCGELWPVETWTLRRSHLILSVTSTRSCQG